MSELLTTDLTCASAEPEPEVPEQTAPEAIVEEQAPEPVNAQEQTGPAEAPNASTEHIDDTYEDIDRYRKPGTLVAADEPDEEVGLEQERLTLML